MRRTLVVKQTRQITLHVAKQGTVERLLDSLQRKIELHKIAYLKIKGTPNDQEFRKICTSCMGLKELDLAECDLTALPESAFISSKKLESVILPAGLETIGRNAFSHCPSLKTVTFGNGSKLKKIGDNAFSYCSSFTSINIPTSVETIGSGAFFDCSSLTSITIPASVETIESKTFSGCFALKSVMFGSNSQLKKIGEFAFHNCHSLTSVYIPASVETIEDYAFYCYSFRGSTSLLKTVTFENGSKLKKIGDQAFYDLQSLKTVDMSACKQVEWIGDSAFGNDSELQLFKIGTTTPPECGNNAFYGIHSSSVLQVPSGSTRSYRNASGWSEFANVNIL